MDKQLGPYLLLALRPSRWAAWGPWGHLHPRGWRNAVSQRRTHQTGYDRYVDRVHAACWEGVRGSLLRLKNQNVPSQCVSVCTRGDVLWGSLCRGHSFILLQITNCKPVTLSPVSYLAGIGHTCWAHLEQLSVTAGAVVLLNTSLFKQVVGLQREGLGALPDLNCSMCMWTGHWVCTGTWCSWKHESHLRQSYTFEYFCMELELLRIFFSVRWAYWTHIQCSHALTSIHTHTHTHTHMYTLSPPLFLLLSVSVSLSHSCWRSEGRWY